MATVYLASKLEECPTRLRHVINVFHALQGASKDGSSKRRTSDPPVMGLYSDTYYDLRDSLIVSEMQLLKRLGFDVQVQLPYALMINYVQLLDLKEHTELPKRAWLHLNDGLQTPIYCMFPPETIATAVIFLAARELSIQLPQEPVPWWRLFDCDLPDILAIVCWIHALPDLLVRQPTDLDGGSKRSIASWLKSTTSKE